ncbi:hypothetical protein [Agrobacterium sp. a22-2]|uniref:hypothetical protein n=1 Tax=Agrobacterium sp. a22-2 TaxID=2283840 RepID=UPI001FED9AD7|nr:hypothetical protein [Agrobacterium sp. a22-2]
MRLAAGPFTISVIAEFSDDRLTMANVAMPIASSIIKPKAIANFSLMVMRIVKFLAFRNVPEIG